MKLWDRVFYEVKKNYPQVKTNKLLVDAATAVMVNNPEWDNLVKLLLLFVG